MLKSFSSRFQTFAFISNAARIKTSVAPTVLELVWGQFNQLSIRWFTVLSINERGNSEEIVIWITSLVIEKQEFPEKGEI